jgi:hypothetical protein
MSSSSAISPAHVLWSHTLTTRVRGLALARENHHLLVWDDSHWIHLFNRKGEVQGQAHIEGVVSGVCAADDGSSYAAVGTRGEVWWLSPDLMPRWRRVLQHPAVAAALDPFGEYLAVADNRGGLHLLDRQGRTLLDTQAARSLHHLVFVPEQPLLLGAADFGLVVCYALTGRCLWRDGPVAHIGGLASSGDATRIAAACFTDGVRLYTPTGQKRDSIVLDEPCQAVALSWDGELLLAATRGKRLLLLSTNGRIRATFPLESAIAAIALDALGAYALAGLADGRIVAFDTHVAAR